MRRALVAMMCFLIFANIASAAVLEVGVKENLETELISLTFDNSSNEVKFSTEFYNTGSVPYKARIKNEVFNGEELVFSGWSQEEDMMPGDKKTFSMYWYAGSAGDYSSKIKVYFGDEIKEYKKVDVLVMNYVEPEDVFEVSNFRTYDDYALFDVTSRVDAENVVVVPNDYIPGWIFEQAEIGNISQNSSKLAVIKYKPSLWVPSNISLEIMSDNGKYYSEKTAEMKKEEGLAGLFYYVVDSLRISFSK